MKGLDGLGVSCLASKPSRQKWLMKIVGVNTTNIDTTSISIIVTTITVLMVKMAINVKSWYCYDY